MKMRRDDYQKPVTRVIKLRLDGLLMSSGSYRGGGSLNGYHNNSSNAWGGGSSWGGSTPGGWTDNGGDAWT